MEEWKDIDGFEGYYQVSNLGRIRSLDRCVVANNHGGAKLLRGKTMKLSKVTGRSNSISKYVVVNLRSHGKNKVCCVHRLVANAFLDNSNRLPTVNHKDGNKENNNVTNLEWATYSDNNTHALRTGLRNPRGTAIVQYDMEHNIVSEYKSIADAARITELDMGSICHCLSNRRDSYAGFIWEYK